MENAILEKNLKCIEKLNPDFYKELLGITELVDDINLTQNANGQYNIMFNSKFVHNNSNPEAEASKIFNSVEYNTFNTIHIVFGLGLGYLFNEFCQKGKGRVILYEPSAELFRAVLDFVDFSQEFQKGDVYIVNDLNSLKKAFFLNYIKGTHVNFTFLTFYKETFKNEFNALLNVVRKLKTMGDEQVLFQRKRGCDFLYSCLEELPKKIFVPELSELKDALKNKPAVIVSAGPSLNLEIETIKKYRDKVVLFCVGTAYKTLVANGIEPDFLNIVEMLNVSAQISGCDTSKLNFISEPYTSAAFFAPDFKRRYFTYSQENLANIWIGNLQNISDEEYETKGTVSYNALYSAKIMGCNPIILVGQDLAYNGSECYAKNSAYNSLRLTVNKKTGKPEIVPEDIDEFCKKYYGNYFGESTEKENLRQRAKAELAKMNSELTQVRGQNGTILNTSIGYALFILFFEDFAKRFKHEITLINTSKNGAKINGFEYQSLETVLNNLEESINVEFLIKDRKSYVIPDFTKIISELEKESYILERVIYLMNSQIPTIKKLKLEFKRSKELTRNIGLYIKQVLETFVDIISNYQPESKIIEIVTYTEKTDLSFAIKEHDGQFDYKTQLIISEKLSDYYHCVDKVVNIKKKLDNAILQVKSIYENINSKDKESLSKN